MHHKYILLDVGFSPSLTSACLDQSSLLLFLHEGHLKGEFDIQTQNGNSITIPTALSQLAHLAETGLLLLHKPKQKANNTAGRLLREPAVRVCTSKPPPTTSWNLNTSSQKHVGRKTYKQTCHCRALPGCVGTG